MPKASAYWIKLRRGLFAFGALLVGLSILSALWTVRSDRARVEAEALRNFANLTALLAEQTARSLESVDLVLAAATSDMRVRGIGDPTVREVRMKDRISGITQIRSLLLLGPDGRVLVDTAGQIPAGIDMSDRTYFTAHRDGSAGRRFVSEPFQGRASGYWEFAVSERVTGTGDRFAGVLAAKMDLAYFDGLYRLLDIGPDGFVELATTDGKVITRVPGPRDAPGVLGTDSDGVLAALKRDGRFTGWSHGVGHAGADPALISAAAIPSLAAPRRRRRARARRVRAMAGGGRPDRPRDAARLGGGAGARRVRGARARAPRGGGRAHPPERGGVARAPGDARSRAGRGAGGGVQVAARRRRGRQPLVPGT